MSPSEDRREYLRREDNFRITLKAWRSEGTFIPRVLRDGAEIVGYSRDLSISGLCVAAEHPLTLGFLVSAQLHIQEVAQPLEFVGEVIRCDPMDNGRHELGLRYMPQWMDEDARERLERFIYLS